jgi:hypothetical protein
MASIDLAKALDLKRAVTNLRTEIVGDWYQDPWGWPELGYLLRHSDLVFQHVGAKGSLQQALIDVPKENWGVRPAVVLDTLDRVTYQALVDRASVHLIGDMSPNVFGWRLPPNNPESGRYSHNDNQWNGYRRHISLLASLNQVALRTDIVSCFGSISIPRLQDAIHDRCPSNELTRRLCDLVEGFAAVPGRPGLPQRSFASAVLANMFMTPLDDVLSHHAMPAPRVLSGDARYSACARWMDDMWLFCREPSGARRAQSDLQSEARSIGLHLNSAKTDVLEGDDVAQQAKEIEHSAVDEAIANDDFAPLGELIERILRVPERASRTSTRFACQRMRVYQQYERVDDLLVNAERMPHVADVLSRLFKEAYEWRSLQDWFLGYASSDWASYEWAVAYLARIFPSSPAPKKEVREFFIRTVRDANTSLPLLAVSSQRIARWDKTEARAAFRDCFSRLISPHARRVVALCALEAKESRSLVRSWLKVDQENAITLQMLENFSWTCPKVQKDFLR